MYLIPVDRLPGSPFMSQEPTTTTVTKCKHREKKSDPYAEARKIRKHHPYEEWLKLCKKMDEADLRKKAETNVFAEFLSKVMPTGQAVPPPPPTSQKMRRGTQTVVTLASVTATQQPPIKEHKYKPTKQERVEDDDEDEDDYNDDDNFVEDEAREYGRENIGPIASPYMMPYVYKRRFLDTEYGVRKEGNIFMIGDSPVLVDTSGDITIKDRVFKGSKGLWELLTRNNVNTEVIIKDDLKSYKKILTMTNAHLTQYQPDGNINITRGKKISGNHCAPLRNRRDGGSSPRYDVTGQSINGIH